MHSCGAAKANGLHADALKPAASFDNWTLSTYGSLARVAISNSAQTKPAGQPLLRRSSGRYCSETGEHTGPPTQRNSLAQGFSQLHRHLDASDDIA